MHLPRILRRNRTACRRLVAGLLLVAFAVAMIGVPLPGWAGKDLSVPFPCMHRQCGCHNAAACWNSCCCHTSAQKLAWAKRHGVQAPKFVVAEAALEKQTKKSEQLARSCCSSKQQPAACCTTVAQANSAESCCQTKSQAKARPNSADWIRLEDARRCQGQAELWMMLGQVLPLANEVELPCEPIAHDWLAIRSSRAEILSSHPDERPPRVTL